MKTTSRAEDFCPALDLSVSLAELSIEPMRSDQGAQVQFLFAGHTLDTDRSELRRGCRDVAVEPQVLSAD